MKETIQRLLGKESAGLPHAHICQVGDPVLRGRAMQIEPEVIRMADFQKVSRKILAESCPWILKYGKRYLYASCFEEEKALIWKNAFQKTQFYAQINYWILLW